MTDAQTSETSQDQTNYLKIGGIALASVVILTVITLVAYRYAKGNAGTVVLPGGTTYLGPQPTSVPIPQAPSEFTVAEGTAWKTHEGITYPFTFEYPETLKLVLFPDDITDSVAIEWNNVPPQSNIMFRVADIAKTEPQMTEYINGAKMEYVNNWWRQFSGLKGVRSVTKFTNAKGMTGYRAAFINHADESPNEDIFFEVPGRPGLMVRFGNGPIEQSVFDRIVDSFSWQATSPTRVPPPADAVQE